MKQKYKRYFVLDNKARKMRIHQRNDPNCEYKLLLYSDIKNVSTEPLKLKEKPIV